MFDYHKDIPNNQWNVFNDGNYVRSFKNVEDARDFCSINNGLLEAMYVSES